MTFFTVKKSKAESGFQTIIYDFLVIGNMNGHFATIPVLEVWKHFQGSSKFLNMKSLDFLRTRMILDGSQNRGKVVLNFGFVGKL